MATNTGRSKRAPLIQFRVVDGTGGDALVAELEALEKKLGVRERGDKGLVRSRLLIYAMRKLAKEKDQLAALKIKRERWGLYSNGRWYTPTGDRTDGSAPWERDR